MSELQALVLGAVQGLGEFLPISSSAHLILVPWFMGWQDHGLSFDVALHIGTLCSVLIFYRDTWFQMAKALLGKGSDIVFYRRLFLMMVIATIPGAAIGFFADKYVETLFRSPLLIAGTMSIMGLFLLLCDRRGADNQEVVRDLPLWKALTIGVAQGFAVIPGFSRSGTTISVGLLLGLRRQEAAHFSFYLSVPITLGAIVHKAPKMLDQVNSMGPSFWVGILTSGIVGWLAISFLLRLVGRYSYGPFVAYRWCVAAAVGMIYFFRQ